MAAAGAISPASSMFNTAIEASEVLGEYKKTTAETVVIAFTNKYIDMSKIAGKQTGTVTFENNLNVGCFREAATDSNSLSICLRAVIAVKCETV